MAESHTLEERFSQLEARVAQLEQQRRIQEDRDVALLARIDGFIDDLRRMERVQMRSFEELLLGQREHKERLGKLEAAAEAATEIAKDHKAAIEEVASRIETVADQTHTLTGHIGNLAEQMSKLATGQQQIITLLAGKPPLHD